MDELRTKVHQGSRGYEIVNAATQLAEFRRFKADRLIGAGELEDVERAKLQIDRDIEFVTGVRDGAIDVKPILSEALGRVETAMKTA